MDHQDFFNNLMIMATADGKLTDEEIALLVERAKKWGISARRSSRNHRIRRQ